MGMSKHNSTHTLHVKCLLLVRHTKANIEERPNRSIWQLHFCMLHSKISTSVLQYSERELSPFLEGPKKRRASLVL
jgi:hypothetical protein